MIATNFTRTLWMSLFLVVAMQTLPAAAKQASSQPHAKLAARKEKPKPQENPNTCKDFYVVTVPKSGSHLVVKLLTMLTQRVANHLLNFKDHFFQVTPKEFELEIFRCKQRKEFGWLHTGDFYGQRYNASDLFETFSKIHPEYIKILQIRDLRDVFVSLVHHFDSKRPSAWSDNGISAGASFDEKLTVAISCMLKSDITKALEWYSDPNTVVMRFEDLVGPDGGGDAQSQQNAIITLANALGVTVSNERLQTIQDRLFGTDEGPRYDYSFHSGQIGSWKKCYTQHHKELFNTLWGHYQQALGYTLAQ
jgi:hypothetical protein